jgi:hypothetical protein
MFKNAKQCTPLIILLAVGKENKERGNSQVARRPRHK